MSGLLSRSAMIWVGLVAAPFWAMGTNLIDERWYPVHGLSIGDLIFLVWMLFAIGTPGPRRLLARALFQVRQHTVVLAAFMILLFVSLAVNAFRFGAQWSDIFAILRLSYFSMIVVFCLAYVERCGPSRLIGAFVSGIALLSLGRVVMAFTAGAPMVVGLPVLRDPNVIGNMLGVGVFFCSFLILTGWTVWPLLMTTVFAAASVLTFSKGAWLMVLVGVAANLVAIVMRYPLTSKGIRRVVAGCTTLLLVLGWLAYSNADTLRDLLVFKLESTRSQATASYRYRFALAGLYAMTDYPLFGLGFRNYPVVDRLYPDVMPEASENAHNVFVQIGAVGGLPALFVFLVLFIYPFVHLWAGVRIRNPGPGGMAYVALAFLVFFGSGAVQLQLIAQPFFWFFTGVVQGWRHREAERVVAAEALFPLRQSIVPAQ